MTRLLVNLVFLALLPPSTMAAAENEIDVVATTLEVVSETDFAPVDEDSALIITEELNSEENSADESNDANKEAAPE